MNEAAWEAADASGRYASVACGGLVNAISWVTRRGSCDPSTKVMLEELQSESVSDYHAYLSSFGRGVRALLQRLA
jgi:hypothetical protein